MAIKQEKVDRLREIVEEMKALADEANDIVRRSEVKSVIARFEAYTYPHMVMALDDNHNYVGGVDPNLSKIADELEDWVEEEEQECELCGGTLKTVMVPSSGDPKTLVEVLECEDCHDQPA